MKVICPLLVAMLSGCSTLSPVVQQVRNGYDKLAEGAELTTCEALSVAAVMRRYPAGTPAGEGWWAMCKRHYEGVSPPWSDQ